MPEELESLLSSSLSSKAPKDREEAEELDDEEVEERDASSSFLNLASDSPARTPGAPWTDPLCEVALASPWPLWAVKLSESDVKRTAVVSSEARCGCETDVDDLRAVGRSGAASDA